MKTSKDPVISYNKIEEGQIDDSVLDCVVNRARFSGCDAYIVPQANNLPLANRRDDILIIKP